MPLANDYLSGLTHERLTEVLDVDPDHGSMVWKICARRPHLVGKEAGTDNKHGYVQICIDGRAYRRARLMWFFVHKDWPAVEVDHVNLKKKDDRIINLREATYAQNCWNTGKTVRNSSGCKGIDWKPEKKRWRVRISVAKRTIHLGYFKDFSDALAARVTAGEKYHGDFARAA